MPETPDQAQLRPLLAEIDRAFRGVRLEDGLSLHQAQAIDLYRSESEIKAARHLDKEERWQDIPDGKIERFASSLSFLDALGFRFHIPRFMVYSLTHGESVAPAVNYTIYNCDFEDKTKDRALARYSLLSSPQRKTIAKYLRFTAAHEECYDARVANRALQRYWSQYE